MTARKPLVVVSGRQYELPAVDSVASSDISLPKVGTVSGGVTHTRDFTTRGSSGVIDGTLTYVTAAGASSINVAAGEGYLRTTNDQQGDLVFCSWAASNGVSIPAPAAGFDTVRFIGVEYNAGTPQVAVRTTFDWNWYTDFPLGRASYDGTTLRILNAYAHAEDTANLARRFNRLTMPFQREEPPEGSGGLVIGETGTRNITLSAGAVWHGFTRYTIAATDTSVSSTLDQWYRRAGGGFTNSGASAQWPNTQYDDGSGTLATLGTNKYACLWLYVDVSDGTMDIIYGQAQYTSVAAAQLEGVPATTPGHLQYHGRLVGRFIFQKNAATASVIESAWASTFASGGLGDHAQLSNLSWTSSAHTDGIGALAMFDDATGAASTIPLSAVIALASAYG